MGGGSGGSGAACLPARTSIAPASLPTPHFLDRCDSELAKLQQQVDQRAERLRREVQAEEAGCGTKVAALEAQWGALRGGFGELEGRMTAATQAATKIGNRMQVGHHHAGGVFVVVGGGHTAGGASLPACLPAWEGIHCWLQRRCCRSTPVSLAQLGCSELATACAQPSVPHPPPPAPPAVSEC